MNILEQAKGIREEIIATQKLIKSFGHGAIIEQLNSNIAEEVQEAKELLSKVNNGCEICIMSSSGKSWTHCGTISGYKCKDCQETIQILNAVINAVSAQDNK